MVKYIHYGSANFNFGDFAQITNGAFNKPYGGLWASRVSSKYGWRDWCESEGYALDSLKTSFEFTISATAKVCHLYTSKDLGLLPQRKDFSTLGLSRLVPFLPDFEQMIEDGWDAVELHLSSTGENWAHDGLYWKMYGWDCDSILIMNPQVILPVAHD